MPLVNYLQLSFGVSLIIFSLLGLVSKSSLADIPNPTDHAPLRESNSMTILGQLCENPYVVAIPARNPQILQQVQQYVPSAFLTDSRLGLYVQASSFGCRAPAESLSHQLRKHSLDARVVYKPVQCRQ
jgi:hypothetical protein